MHEQRGSHHDQTDKGSTRNNKTSSSSSTATAEMNHTNAKKPPSCTSEGSSSSDTKVESLGRSLFKLGISITESIKY